MVNDSSAQRSLEAPDNRLQHLDSREVLVVCFDQRPWRKLRRRAIDHVGDRLLVRAPLGAIAPVVRRDLEALERRLLARLEALQLLGLAHLEPELANNRVVVDELLLELVDLLVRAAPVELGTIAFDALDQHAPIPCAIEDRDAAARRNDDLRSRSEEHTSELQSLTNLVCRLLL